MEYDCLIVSKVAVNSRPAERRGREYYSVWPTSYLGRNVGFFWDGDVEFTDVMV